MLLDIEVSGKKTAIYNDEPHENIINGKLMKELSSVSIVDIPFNLHLSQLYLLLLNDYLEENEKLEERVF